MAGFTPINLSALPAPEVIRTVEFEAMFAQMKAYALELMPDMETALSLESEPATKILRVCAYFRTLDLASFNDGARASMLAHSTGTNLDGLAAFWGVQRQIIQEEDDSVEPTVPLIMEDDAALRARTQLSLEGHTTAGTRGSYIFWALSSDGAVKDATVDSPEPGAVTVTVLSHDNGGVASAALLTAVEETLNGVRPLTDNLTVQSATIVTYQVTATLTLYDWPDTDAVMAAAQTAVESYVGDRNRLGHDVTLSGLYAALHQPGVQNVQIVQPAADIIIGDDTAANCPVLPDLTFGGNNV